ncbi:MAG TPA: c-type cytochrome [Bordetella sp.]
MLGLLHVGLLPIAARAQSGADLAASKNCLACHQVDTKRVGPPFRSVAERYAGQSTAMDYLTDKVRHGSRGDWGAVPMPAQTQVSEADAKALVQWVLSLSSSQP